MSGRHRARFAVQQGICAIVLSSVVPRTQSIPPRCQRSGSRRKGRVKTICPSSGARSFASMTRARAIITRSCPKAEVGATVGGETMSDISLYRRGLRVNFPTSREQRGGSCIFTHVWRRPGSPTLGGVALSESDVAALQIWSEAPTLIAILPLSADGRLQGCIPKLWRLPAHPLQDVDRSLVVLVFSFIRRRSIGERITRTGELARRGEDRDLCAPEPPTICLRSMHPNGPGTEQIRSAPGQSS
jgi:hypothetical protein